GMRTQHVRQAQCGLNGSFHLTWISGGYAGWHNSTLPSRAASAPECQYLSVPKTRAVIERSMSVWSRGGFAFIIGTKILETSRVKVKRWPPSRAHRAPVMFLQIATEFASVGSVIPPSQPIRLARDDKLVALRRIDKGRQWSSLDDQVYCTICKSVISGRQIEVVGGTNGLRALH